MSKGINTSVEDYLDEDPVISNQTFVCVSIFTPNSIKTPEGEVINQEHKVRAFKIRGVYSSKERAEKRCEEIRKFDKYHHVFIGEVGKWLPWDDDASNAEDAVYAEPKLNEMMKSYNESQQKAAEYNEERKMKAHADATKKKKEEQKNKNKKENNLDELKNDIIKEDVSIMEEINREHLVKSELIEDKEKLEKLNENIILEKNELEHEKEIIQNKENTINKIDDELEKAQKLYEELMKKYNLEKNASQN
jgi:chemotaxis protein histidine kinase CheA